MRIEKISDKDSMPYHLLLLADETTDAINKYKTATSQYALLRLQR